MSQETDDIHQRLIDASNAAARTQEGSRVLQEQSLRDLAFVEDRLKADAAASRPGFGLRFQQITPVYR